MVLAILFSTISVTQIKPIGAENTIIVPDDYLTIQEAINAANPGDMILVAAGTYNESVTVDKSLILEGENMTSIIAYGVKIFANNVRISNFTLKNWYGGASIEIRGSNNTIRSNLVTSHTGRISLGIDIRDSQYITIDENHIVNNTYGVTMWNSSNVVLFKNYIIKNDFGVDLGYSDNCLLQFNNLSLNERNLSVYGYRLSDFIHDMDNTNHINGKPVYYLVNQRDVEISVDAGYVAAVNSSNIRMTNICVTNNGQGILFAFTTNSIIENVTLIGNKYGVVLCHSTENIIAENNIAGSRQWGIFLRGSEKNEISKNHIDGGCAGISVRQSNGSLILENRVQGNDGIGIRLSESSNNTIAGNVLTENAGLGLGLFDGSNDNNVTDNLIVKNGFVGFGISLSSGNIAVNNTMNNNSFNFEIFGYEHSDFINDIDSSNKLDGKSIIYLINQEDVVIDAVSFPDAGYVGIVDSRNITVKDLILKKNGQGVLFAYSTGSAISNITAYDNQFANIHLVSSNNSLITRNTLISWYTEADGIYIDAGFHNFIHDNFISGTPHYSAGITLGSDIASNRPADFNTITENEIINHHAGIFVHQSEGANIIYHNDFVDNDVQVAVSPTFSSRPAQWDNGSEGNYWSDYEERYPDAEELDNSGIWDTPYVIDENNQDNYPSIKPYKYVPPDLIQKYFPHLIFDEDEQFYPCFFYYDDSDIDDNPKDYNTSWPLTCHVHTTECRWKDVDYLVLEYWFYYARDNKLWDIDLLGAHDHDWESVYVFVRREDYSPAFISYFHHVSLTTGDDVYCVYEWNSSSFDIVGNHPLIHVARSSHASYESTFLGYGGCWKVPVFEPCDDGLEKSFDDFTIIDIPYLILLDVEFGEIEAPWARERWNNPVDVLESMTKASYSLIGMKELGSKLHLHLYDQSRHIGMNYETNETEIEIPGAYYEDLGNTTIIMIPPNLTEFKLVVDAVDAHEDVEEYQIAIKTIRDSEKKDEDSITDSIEKEQQKEHEPKLDKNGNIIVIREFSVIWILLILVVFTLGIVLLGKKWLTLLTTKPSS